MDKVLIFGGRGYIAGHLKTVYPDAITPNVDIADPQAVSDALESAKPDIVINTAGKTGRPNIDWCETNKTETLRSNVLGPLVLLDECMKKGIYLVHVGSGCIYQGDGDGNGFSEEDPPNFTGSYYSRTKMLSDQALKDFPVLQLRLRMPFDSSDHPRNLINKLRKYTDILDVKNSMTYLPDFLKAIKILTDRRATGIFNMVNPGGISPYRIMQKYKSIVDPDHSFNRLELKDLGKFAVAPRSNCILNARKLIDFGVNMLAAEDALEVALTGMAEARKTVVSS